MWPVFSEIENDINDFDWQAAREGEIFTERDNRGHRGAFLKVEIWGLVGVREGVEVSVAGREGESFAYFSRTGYVDGIPLSCRAGHAVEHCCSDKV